MTVDTNGMSVREYLAQGEIWIDDRTGHTFQVSEMSQTRREYAARQLVRTATAVISLAEGEAARQGELQMALRLVRQSPRDWVVRTALYRALYPDPAEMTETSGNQTDDHGVVHMDGTAQVT
jgi:hypothetical protein